MGDERITVNELGLARKSRASFFDPPRAAELLNDAGIHIVGVANGGPTASHSQQRVREAASRRQAQTQ
jgi:hypothetical protein